jgi:hypothetical protein
MSLSGVLGMSSIPVQETTNYLVPSSGGTHAVQIDGVFSAEPAYADWNAFAQANFPFQPQGVFIDNTQGSGPVTLGICTSVGGPSLWNVTCPAGAQLQAQFPAPNGQVTEIVGDGEVNLIFVDFPVLPAAGAVVITGGSVGISGQPISVTVPVNVSGSPYQAQITPALASTPQYSGAITGATKTVTLTPTVADQYLRKLIMAFSGNCSLSSAGNNVLTVTANGVQIYEENVYLPASAPDTPGAAYVINLDFSENLGIYMGSGDLVITIGTALNTGLLDCNAYFA